MENQGTVPPESDSDLTSNTTVEQPQETLGTEQEEKQVPLHALQKERQRRQEEKQKLDEANEKLRFYEQQKEAESDDSRYESATIEQLDKSQEETLRKVEERIWRRDNPEKCKQVDAELKEFLKRRPNLVPAINSSGNRYAEAWELMNALSPKERQQQSQQAQANAKPPAPGSPSGVPKGAALNATVDLMSMSDSEFNEWRRSKRGRR